MLARSFRSSAPMRHGLPAGPNGEERPIDSNFPNGISRKLPPPKPLGLPNAQTADDPAPSPTTGTPSYAPGGGASSSGLTRARPNRGGTITRNGVTTTYAPSAGQSADPNRPNRGGTLTRQIAPGVKATTIVPPSPSSIRSQMTPALPTAMPAALQPAIDSPGAPAVSQQSEGANPMTGATSTQPEDSTEDIDPGQALGMKQRGSSLPRGTDAQPSSGNVGGSGLYARTFSSPKSASIYDKYVKDLFG